MIRIYNMENIPEEKRNLILSRSKIDIECVKNKVKSILEDVKTNRDEAVRRYTVEFDRVKIDTFKVSKKEIKSAWKKIDRSLLDNIKKQIDYSKKFHKRQLMKEWKFEIEKGIILGEKFTPIESVGLYVPGGRAVYPTVLQILAVPAIIANVPRIVVCTPPNKDGNISESILVTADILGITEIYKIGGAQAIASLAYGTESIKSVKKIVGPGNIYVSCAKMIVFGLIDIDMLAGPSESLIIADSYADPAFIAADILARCEHDTEASAVLLTDSNSLAIKVNREIIRQFSYLKRKQIISKSLSKYSAIIVFKRWDEIIEFANDYAAEHLQLMVKKPWDFLVKIKNAGSIFLGYYAPVAIGDYASGTNHVLPTGQFAKMFSPVGVETFQKKSEFQYLTKEGIKKLEPIVKEISAVEGLDGHYNSVKVRLDK
ncbi:MAG: histidinol dehydrogenase [Thermoplasmatales archaeon]|nr:MAG: histidinol dehydrogenase [Thermoplasmatales archaeon]